LIKPDPGEMVPVELREIQHPLEKQALAARAVELLSPGDAVIIDGGTTTSMLATSIPDFPLRIITNSVRLVASLEAHRQNYPRLDIYLTGGILYPHSGLLLGPSAEASVSQYHAQWAFLSVGGITDSGTFNTNELVVEVERAMIGSAEKVVILADHSKIGKQALCSAIGLDEVDILITDEFPENDHTLQKIAEVGVQVIRVSAEGSKLGAN
jgi:DeoR/GlpR family transcriptional regulator of sugar metabolism